MICPKCGSEPLRADTVMDGQGHLERVAKCLVCCWEHTLTPDPPPFPRLTGEDLTPRRGRPRKTLT